MANNRKDIEIRKMFDAALAGGKVHTQEDCCAFATQVDINALGVPQTDAEIIERAYPLASGLFGPAFRNADQHQRLAWIDMCERALRKAAGMVAI
jgi:hypothetical protein